MVNHKQIPQPPTPKPPRPHTTRPMDLALIDTATLTDAELFAHYKRIALINDVKFFIDHCQLSGQLEADAKLLYAELQTRTATTADRERYYRLTDAWHWASVLRVK